MLHHTNYCPRGHAASREPGASPRRRTGRCGWLTVDVPEIATRPVEVFPDLEETTQTGEPAVAHIVKTEPGESAAAKVLEARIYGSPLEALCGHVWVPSRDPKSLPLCETCKDIYETYRAFNDGLNERPDE